MGARIQSNDLGSLSRKSAEQKISDWNASSCASRVRGNLFPYPARHMEFLYFRLTRKDHFTGQLPFDIPWMRRPVLFIARCHVTLDWNAPRETNVAS